MASLSHETGILRAPIADERSQVLSRLQGGKGCLSANALPTGTPVHITPSPCPRGEFRTVVLTGLRGRGARKWGELVAPARLRGGHTRLPP